MEEGMETVPAVLVFLGAAFVGRLAARSQVAEYIDHHRWLRVGAFALAFFLIAAILTGGPPHL
jgi:fucose permease